MHLGQSHQEEYYLVKSYEKCVLHRQPLCSDTMNSSGSDRLATCFSTILQMYTFIYHGVFGVNTFSGISIVQHRSSYAFY